MISPVHPGKSGKNSSQGGKIGNFCCRGKTEGRQESHRAVHSANHPQIQTSGRIQGLHEELRERRSLPMIQATEFPRHPHSSVLQSSLRKESADNDSRAKRNQKKGNPFFHISLLLSSNVALFFKVSKKDRCSSCKKIKERIDFLKWIFTIIDQEDIK